MAIASVVKLSELELQNRIDPEFYSPEYMDIMDNLRQLECLRIGKCCFVTSGSTPPERDPDLKNGIILLKTVNIREGYIDINSEEPFFIDENLDEKLKSSRLQPNDVLINIVGATHDVIGRVALVPEDFPRANITQAMSLIRLRTPDFLPEYIFAFLYSKYGRKQVCRIARPTAQYNLNHEETKSIIVPKISKKFQNEIRNIWEKFYDFYRKSINIYTQAENLLLEELGLKDFKPKYELSYTANLSRSIGVHRVDAEYFQPAYDEIENHLIKKYDTVLIKRIKFIEVTTGQYTENYVLKNEGKPYIRGTDIKNGTIDTNNLVYIAPEDQLEDKKAKEGDVVVTRVGTIGLSARIPKECEGGTISDNLIRIRIFDEEKLNSYYLALYLGTLIGVSFMIKNSRGSVQQRLNQETLKEVIIPILPLETQQKIASLVQQSHEARRKAKGLLEEAKRKVEGAIENEIKK
ncbi:MAG: restriction endonuclease subunit S [Methanocellales archaeon]|nr:restriction endonuclease subunit S [Methanocellales archaeon]MDD3292112.1 restriction endonuclease subunit S [Methanocellales archaeon]MDD5235349.1 restriction endonuclease subunit S [Methanocellales archaeon]MDD5485703.1 restriction endonuclease subunit S [Methanocellales archaeon]